MAEPIPAQKSPFAVGAVAGSGCPWCDCGRSWKQPFCGGSGKGIGPSPLPFDAKEAGTVWFCGCKTTRHQPTWSGMHNTL